MTPSPHDENILGFLPFQRDSQGSQALVKGVQADSNGFKADSKVFRMDSKGFRSTTLGFGNSLIPSVVERKPLESV